MSRIGKTPIAVPSSVEVTLDPTARTVGIKGPKGSLSLTYRSEVSVAWEQDEKMIRVSVVDSTTRNKQAQAYWGTTRSLINNMVEGVTKGYEEKLEIHGVGWTAKQQGMKLLLNVGFCNTLEMEIPAGLDLTVANQHITVTGIDKQVVGNFAHSIQNKRKPEPYNGKGIRFAGEEITRKQGKAFGA